MPLPPLETPPLSFRRIRGSVVGIFALVLVALVALVFNLVQLCTLLCRPFSQKLFRIMNRWILNGFGGLCVLASKWAHGISVVVTGDPIPEKENTVVMVNHQQMSDIVFFLFFARAHQSIGDIKWTVKSALKAIPGIGWGLYFADMVFVKRNWLVDRQSIHRTFSRYLKERIPIWMLSFVEGTRMSESKLKAGIEFAISRGITPLRHLLVPRTKGFVAAVEGLRGHLAAIYDVTIGYLHGVPSLWQYVRGFAPVAHLHIRRFSIDSLPGDGEALAGWLFERFREKDELLEAFYQRGAFPGVAQRM